MTRRRSIAIWIAVAAGLAILAAVLITRLRPRSLTLTGVVLRQDSDPRKQVPIANVKISATNGEQSAQAVSDASGFFKLNLTNAGWRDRPLILSFQHADYRPVALSPPVEQATQGDLYVMRLTPNVPVAMAPADFHDMSIKDVRVRYTEKTSNIANVGSMAKTFTVANVGDVPCAPKLPCSPDGKWKASQGGITLDAGAGQQFENTRVSCIAGPCPFTRIDSGSVPRPGRVITVQVTNWSDTVTFLVETEVTRFMPSDAVRQAYPAIFGRSMSFTLPATAQGPSIEADLGGSDIVFPLGPALQLSWADCTLQVAPDKTKLYLCELKPGYEFAN